MKFKRSPLTSKVQQSSVSHDSTMGTNTNLGANSANLNKKQKLHNMESNSYSGASANNISVGGIDLGIDMSPLMQDMSMDTSDSELFNLYRDIYYHDAVGGSAVDMYSTLPFSEFSIGGADDKFLAPYREAIERLNLRTGLNEITTDHLVTGSYIGSMLYSKKEKKFIDLMNHRRDNATIHPLPFSSQDPIIEVTLPPDVKATLAKDSPRIAALRKRLGTGFLDKLEEGNLELDPLGTLYLPRKTFSFGEGTSWFRRVVPLYLIEKNLFRGTLVESGKRQRGIMHVSMGDGDQWQPDMSEMEFMTDLLQNADLDPLGAIVTTRLGVQIDEFRQGGDFWKVTDLWDQTAQFKLRALGISEAFLSGEAQYNNMDGAMTVFIESMKAFRDNLTRRVFYNKVFPLVSMMNGLAVNSKGKIIRKNNLMDGDIEDRLRVMQDGSKLFIPSVHWEKQLSPEADQARMDILSSMKEMGVPVPLRAMAAAGGFNLDSLLMKQEEDLAIQRKMHEYQKRVKDLSKEFGGGDDDMDSMSSISKTFGRSSILGANGRPLLKDRNFGDPEIVGRSRTGKKKYVHNQNAAHQKANESIMRAMVTISENEKTPLTHRTRTRFKPTAKENRINGGQ